MYIEQILLGIIQGVAEWLPVSSEGMIILARTHILHLSGPIDDAIRQALFLHFGTFLAALVYFRHDVLVLIKSFVQYKQQSQQEQKLFQFLAVTTLISGGIGFALIKVLVRMAEVIGSQETVITLVVGCLLMITGFLELCAKRTGCRKIEEINWIDFILLGVVQGLAALPGLSRSGLTVSALLLRKVENSSALRLSFLMSLPIVLVGNLVLNIGRLSFSLPSLVGLLCSFAFGLATIHVLLKTAAKINFGYFVLLFAALTLLAAVI